MAWRYDQWVKCLSCKDEDPCSDSCHPQKKQDDIPIIPVLNPAWTSGLYTGA